MIASFTMGSLSDKIGRCNVLLALSSISAMTSFAYGWTISYPYIIVFILGLIYSFVCLGDSPILSAALTEAVDDAYMGTAFGLRSLLEFGAGAVSSDVFSVVLDISNATTGYSADYETWGWAFGILGLGGLVTVLSSYFYGRISHSESVINS